MINYIVCLRKKNIILRYQCDVHQTPYYKTLFLLFAENMTQARNMTCFCLLGFHGSCLLFYSWSTRGFLMAFFQKNNNHIFFPAEACMFVCLQERHGFPARVIILALPSLSLLLLSVIQIQTQSSGYMCIHWQNIVFWLKKSSSTNSPLRCFRLHEQH